MTDKEYGIICEQIMNATMDNMDIPRMKQFQTEKTENPSPYGIIYDSAVNSRYPLTLVYTPPGTGRHSLILDRIRMLEKAGVPQDKILLLNMNIAKTRQLQEELGNVHVRTFSEFAHDIIHANYPKLNLCDMQSIANLLKIKRTSTQSQEFARKLLTKDPLERMVMLTVFINRHTESVLNMLQDLHLTEYSLDAMLCQNMIYRLKKNPYTIDAIIVNGIHNMPVPSLCTVLSYADRYGCNLFMTGDPGEAIYDFNMAYGKTMNLLSAYRKDGIDVIHLNNVPYMDPNIKAVAEMLPMHKIDSNIVTTAHVQANYGASLPQILNDALGTKAPYVYEKLQNKEPMLFIARSRIDIQMMKQTLRENYPDIYPKLKITDLTEIQHKSTSYGTIAAGHYTDLIARYPDGICIRQLFAEIYNMLRSELKHMDKPSYQKTAYEHDFSKIQEFYEVHKQDFGDTEENRSLSDAISTLIYLEAKLIQDRAEQMQTLSMKDLENSDIVFSTVHSAADIHMDNAVVLMQITNEETSPEIYRVELTRAMKSEYLIFINRGTPETQHQRYLKTNIIT